ncbi:GGDEF domain-containing protein [Pseudofrankia sp. DC12]|uniref:GGDEF domain-containing protein n=1 Tax=Pseudofrankia sp. DC12 TaxID=683315 RepID=UPI000A0595D0|nr:GGDEF domain-containing protein [Pseudofrankia sp. DC12]
MAASGTGWLGSAGRIVAALDRPLRAQAGTLTVGAAVSTAYPGPLRTVRAADLAMYDAKRHGRVRVALGGADGSVRPIDAAARPAGDEPENPGDDPDEPDKAGERPGAN